jgi:hypothetical protein
MKFPRIAIMLSSGNKIVVKRPQDFKGDLMKWWIAEEVKPVVEAEILPEEPVVVAEIMDSGMNGVDEKAKFLEMKAARAWVRPETKEEYSRLKAIYG